MKKKLKTVNEFLENFNNQNIKLILDSATCNQNICSIIKNKVKDYCFESKNYVEFTKV